MRVFQSSPQAPMSRVILRTPRHQPGMCPTCSTGSCNVNTTTPPRMTWWFLLTALTAIFLSLNSITGFFGVNFE